MRAGDRAESCTVQVAVIAASLLWRSTTPSLSPLRLLSSGTQGCLGGTTVRRRTRDRKVAGSTPGRGAIQSTRSTQPSIPPAIQASMASTELMLGLYCSLPVRCTRRRRAAVDKRSVCHWLETRSDIDRTDQVDELCWSIYRHKVHRQYILQGKVAAIN